MRRIGIAENGKRRNGVVREGRKKKFATYTGKREEKREKVFESRFFCGTYIV